jgi:hypothetical protein
MSPAPLVIAIVGMAAFTTGAIAERLPLVVARVEVPGVEIHIDLRLCQASGLADGWAVGKAGCILVT